MRPTGDVLVILATALAAAVGSRRIDVRNSAKEAKLGTKPAALATVLTRMGVDERRLFASIGLEMPDATMFVACSSDLVESLSALVAPRPSLRFSIVLNKYKGLNRDELTKKGLWGEFNEQRIDIMKFALQEGHNGVWYMDGDTFLLAPLPKIAASVGLSRHRIDPAWEAVNGEWNSGFAFFRSFAALDTWKRASQAAAPSIAVHQVTLRAVAANHSSEMVELGCGINVGGFRMMPGISEGHKAYYDQVQCKGGVVQYRNCPIISGHWHADDGNGLEVRRYMERALRECGHPFLQAWLQSYEAMGARTPQPSRLGLRFAEARRP